MSKVIFAFKDYLSETMLSAQVRYCAPGHFGGWRDSVQLEEDLEEFCARGDRWELWGKGISSKWTRGVQAGRST